MVINWNPRKAICFWRALGGWQDFLILYCGRYSPPGSPKAAPRWGCWGSSERHPLVPLSLKGHSRPNLSAEDWVVPPFLLPVLAYTVRVCDRPGAEPRLGACPWVPATKWGSPVLHYQSQPSLSVWLPLQQGRTSPAHSRKPEPHHLAPHPLLSQPSRDLLSLTNLAQAPPLGL